MVAWCRVWISAFAGFGLVLVLVSCRKGSPTGADTTAKTAAVITVKVLDSGDPVEGLRVEATDPAAVLSSGVTDANGVVQFEAARVGVWTLTVPTQGNFYHSTAKVELDKHATAPQAVFTAEGQQLLVTELTPPEYGIFGADIRYRIEYLQPANLKIPLRLEAVGEFPSDWSVVFSPIQIGDVSSISTLSLIVPRGSFAQPLFSINGYRTDGSRKLGTSSFRIRRTYSVQSDFYISQVQRPSHSQAPTTYLGNVTLSTLNAGDSLTSWVGSFRIQALEEFDGMPAPVDCHNLYYRTRVGNFATDNDAGNCDWRDNRVYSFSLRSGEVEPVTLLVNEAAGSSRTYPRFGIAWTSAVADVAGNTAAAVRFGDLRAGDVFTMTK